MATKSNPNELRITRVYDAPVKTVWEAWTDPKQVAKWWGPRGFTITTHSKDLRTGGSWNYTMHGPDGVDYPNSTVYLEVDEYKKLVYDHGANDDRPPLFRVTVLFAEIKGKTKMDMTMAMASPEAAEQSRKIIKKADGNSTWDRLAEYLEKNKSGKDAFVINRSFDAPIETIFEMWTNPKHISKWTPPTGFTMEFIEVDVKPGGGGFYCMTGANFKMYGRTKYLEIKPHERIVYTQQFCDEKGNISRHPMAPTWPETMLTTITLAEEEAGRTCVTVNWECYGKTTAEELEVFIKAKAGMSQGWGGSFDKLDNYLAKNI